MKKKMVSFVLASLLVVGILSTGAYAETGGSALGGINPYTGDGSDLLSSITVEPSTIMASVAEAAQIKNTQWFPDEPNKLPPQFTDDPLKITMTNVIDKFFTAFGAGEDADGKEIAGEDYGFFVTADSTFALNKDLYLPVEDMDGQKRATGALTLISFEGAYKFPAGTVLPCDTTKFRESTGVWFEASNLYIDTIVENKKEICTFSMFFADHKYMGEYSTLLSLREISAEGQTPSPTPDKPSSWAETQVNAAIKANLVPASLQSNYTQSTTRAEFCALAARLYENVKGEITQRESFTDTSDVNVEKMAATGVVSGVGNDQFDPNAQLTREQAATMLSRLASAIGKPLTEQAPVFADNTRIASWAADAVGQMQATGIMGGVGDNTFSPQGAYTREQSIVTILRTFEMMK